ncbi:MAG: hypothetical protein MZU95_16480 [Desulfomicrobium escambiense]|nr:hypothetical protein [Desulfomicrobium escambiense]
MRTVRSGTVPGPMTPTRRQPQPNGGGGGGRSGAEAGDHGRDGRGTGTGRRRRRRSGHRATGGGGTDDGPESNAPNPEPEVGAAPEAATPVAGSASVPDPSETPNGALRQALAAGEGDLAGDLFAQAPSGPGRGGGSR